MDSGWIRAVILLLFGFAGAEGGSRFSQPALNSFCERVRAAEHAPRDRFYLLERLYGLAEVVERGGRVLEKSTKNA